MPVTKQNIEDVFRYHAPTPEQIPKYEAIRAAARHFADVVLDNVSSCADQQAAIRLIREAMMTANAGVATKGIF